MPAARSTISSAPRRPSPARRRSGSTCSRRTTWPASSSAAWPASIARWPSIPIIVPAMLMKADLLERLGRAAESLALFRAIMPPARTLDACPSRCAQALARGVELVRGRGRPRAPPRWSGPLAEVHAAFPGRGLRPGPGLCRAADRPPQGLCPAAGQRPFPLSAGDRILPARPFPLVRGAGGEDRGDHGASCWRCWTSGDRGFRPLCRLRSPPSRSINGRSSTTARAGAPGSSGRTACGRTRIAPAARRPPPLLERLPLLDLPGKGPTAMFSILEPRTRIPPHTGSEQCPRHRPPAAGRAGGLRLSGRRGDAHASRPARPGRSTTRSSMRPGTTATTLRAILILDIWNPLLSEAERAAVRRRSARSGGSRRVAGSRAARAARRGRGRPRTGLRLDGAAGQGALLRGTAPPGRSALTLDGRDGAARPDGRFLHRLRPRRPAAARAGRPARATAARSSAALSVAPRAWRIEQHQHGPADRRADARISAAARGRAGADRRGAGARLRRAWAGRSASSGRRAAGSAALFGSQRIYRGGVPAAYHSGADIAAGAGARGGRAGRRGGHAGAAAALQPGGQSRHRRSRHGPDQRLPASRRSASVRDGPGGPAGRADRPGRRDRPRHRPASPLEPGLERRPDRSRSGSVGAPRPSDSARADPDSRLVVDPHHEAAERGAVDHHRLAGPRPAPRAMLLSVCAQVPPSCSVTTQWPRPSCWREATTPSIRADLVLFLLVVAAAEDREARQGEAEQPAPALAHLGAVDHDHVAPLGRRLRGGGGGVEACSRAASSVIARQRTSASNSSGRCCACGCGDCAARRPRTGRRSKAASKDAGCVVIVAIPQRDDVATILRRRGANSQAPPALAMWQICHASRKWAACAQARRLLQFRFIP